MVDYAAVITQRQHDTTITIPSFVLMEYLANPFLFRLMGCRFLQRLFPVVKNATGNFCNLD